MHSWRNLKPLGPPSPLAHPPLPSRTLPRRPPPPPQCFHAAGVPPGVLSCVTGKGSEIGDHLTAHPLANCISFTGGDTGIDIARRAGMVPVQVSGRECWSGGGAGGWMGGLAVWCVGGCLFWLGLGKTERWHPSIAFPDGAAARGGKGGWEILLAVPLGRRTPT